MSSVGWPTLQEAQSLAFPELARRVREGLTNSGRTLNSEATKASAYSLVEILEAKIPPAPPKPKPTTPTEPPTLPPEPAVDQLPKVSSQKHDSKISAYAQLLDNLTRSLKRQVRIKRRNRIARQIEELRAAHERALTELTLSSLSEEQASRYRKQCAEHERWQHQKRKLLQDHSSQLERIKSVNKDNERRWTLAVDAWKRRNETPLRIVQNLRRDLDAALGNSDSYNLTQLPWRFLPPSETGEEAVMSILRDFHTRRSDIRIDESRLRYAYSLKPEKIFIGEDEFDGYFAFVFAGDSKVLLENPIEGNAAYIFGQDWRSLSKLSKTELLTFHHKQLTRVIHSSGWKLDIKQALKG